MKTLLPDLNGQQTIAPPHMGHITILKYLRYIPGNTSSLGYKRSVTIHSSTPISLPYTRPRARSFLPTPSCQLAAYAGLHTISLL
jgi:hypothetical protein